jgi:tRNA1Val (adenine37-N6)-methyltransferase
MEIRKESAFKFKCFDVKQDKCAMKVGTDGVLLGAWTTINKHESVLDVGTGTGLIALMLAQRSLSRIDAVEIDGSACNQAKDNFRASPWHNRLHAYESSFQLYAKTETRYDLIVSNPPFFINAHRSESDARNMARHTNETLTFEELIFGVGILLRATGKFCVILPIKEGRIFIQVCEDSNLFCTRITRVKTRADKSEKRLLLEFGRHRVKVENTELIILNEEGEYTKSYVELTKDFYTHYPERTSW